MSRISKRPEVFDTTLEAIKEIAPNMLEVKFSKPDGFYFIPGQFVNIFVTPPHRRAFSIVHADEQSISFIVELIPIELNGKASEYFRNIQIGAKTQIMGPLGRFGLKDSNKPKVFIATGSGIAPFIPMIKSIKNNSENHLFFGTRTKQDDFVTQIFADSDINYTLCLSRERENLENAFVGRVTDAIFEAELDFKDSEFYICGSTNMITDVDEILRAQGATDIFFERYY